MYKKLCKGLVWVLGRGVVLGTPTEEVEPRVESQAQPEGPELKLQFCP